MPLTLVAAFFAKSFGCIGSEGGPNDDSRYRLASSRPIGVAYQQFLATTTIDPTLEMLPIALLALVSYFPLFSLILPTFAKVADSFLTPPGTSSSTGHNAQRVLEHSPVSDTDCRQPVCLLSSYCDALPLLEAYNYYDT